MGWRENLFAGAAGAALSATLFTGPTSMEAAADVVGDAPAPAEVAATGLTVRDTVAPANAPPTMTAPSAEFDVEGEAAERNKRFNEESEAVGEDITHGTAGLGEAKDELEDASDEPAPSAPFEDRPPKPAEVEPETRAHEADADVEF
jgi:hypothetical protein